mmetsp:Transcript_43133/g.101320  ORF Transcript_43133/g.101320 Transcript_43133/m.101320 type:complete len:127 (+) Transcript_43133:52-432(+)|eukprot:CAMPEP_0178448576 /NCGR_PEP_ID=MMETSP0689_2-20121128/42063_1 /TAXON_ID=160604 /ORGANISM="Amphidinium massartii, Strain CS-259" /LENGTH=126 /DNA_ID=CAMNT_0020073781 /DNA_START=52 /DNA_END=432 /DNA_ORIENTATION=+
MPPKEIIVQVGQGGFDIEQFKTQIYNESDKRLHIVDVYTKWCGPCMAIVPTLKNLQMQIDQFEERCTVTQVERTCMGDYEERFPETSKPRFLFYKGGAEVHYVDGLKAPEILRFINDNLPTMEVDE